MEYERRKASSDVLKPRNIYIYIYNITVAWREQNAMPYCLQS
jgi:hypothetical protein